MDNYRHGGRCEVCKGDGTIKGEMYFLPDVYVKCEDCDGSRYNPETLSIKWKGYSIADILNSTVENSLKIYSFIFIKSFSRISPLETPD